MLSKDCRLDFNFEFGQLDNGKIMNLEICYDSKKITVVPTNLKADVKLLVDLPCKVILKFSGKNMNTDTILDENNNIKQDLYVKIKKISLDGFNMGHKHLHQNLCLTAENGQEFCTNYIGFNGAMELTLSYNNVFRQIMDWNSQ